ncbi:hypothetical protein N9I00_00950 [bacterium]|nr:hypothetical protein [bacterium]
MPAYRVKLRRGTTLQHKNFIGEVGEITVDTDLKRLVTHDGVTPGGHIIAAHSDIKTDVNEFTDNDALFGDHTFEKQGTTIDTTVDTPTVNISVQVGQGSLYRSGSPGNVFYFKNVTDGETTFTPNPLIRMTPGVAYIFDVSASSNTGHPLRFTNNSGNSTYTKGVLVSGTPGTADAKVTFTYPTPGPWPLWYYCTNHGIGMGGRIAPIDITLNL